MSAEVPVSDEQRHVPGSELAWAESWTFDFVASDGSFGGWARLVLRPNLGSAWYHAFLAGPHRQLVAVIDTEVPPPVQSLEIRTTGLWATHICETAHDHWTIGLEAFGLGVDDPLELYGRQYGDQVPLGFDLEWEGVGPAIPDSGASEGYEQPCRVIGEVLVGTEAVDLDGRGSREHHWGVRRDWDDRWFRVHGAFDDGTWFSASLVDGHLASGTATLDGEPVELLGVSEAMAAGGLPASAHVRLPGTEIAVAPVAVTPLAVEDAEARVALAPRALCRLEASDGRVGTAWAEWNLPQP